MLSCYPPEKYAGSRYSRNKDMRKYSFLLPEIYKRIIITISRDKYGAKSISLIEVPNCKYRYIYIDISLDLSIRKHESFFETDLIAETFEMLIESLIFWYKSEKYLYSIYLIFFSEIYNESFPVYLPFVVSFERFVDILCIDIDNILHFLKSRFMKVPGYIGDFVVKLKSLYGM